MSDVREYEFEIEQDGMVVASGSGSDRDRIRSMAMHYALMYAQDGPVTMRIADSRFLAAPPTPARAERTDV